MTHRLPLGVQSTHMRNLLTLLCLAAYCFSPAQVPLKIWDNTIGGAGADVAVSAISTMDGGILIVGTSSSGVGYDKTQPGFGSTDIWVVKLNASGIVEWDKTYGTSTSDYVSGVVQGLDGKYMIAAYTTGGISGSKTEAAVGGRDYWLLGLDATGTLVWQNTIGGNFDDYTSDVVAVSGGYVVGGYSASGISGDKTSASFGGYDYWLIKIDFTGNILWQYAFGGSANDYLRKVMRLSDGTYLLSGDSDSGVSGNKSQPSKGYKDIWLIKMAGGGTITWQKDIGGAEYDEVGDILETDDGHIMLAASSSSNINEDKSEFSGNDYSYPCDEPDYGNWDDNSDQWYLRLTASGEVEWEDTYQDYDQTDSKRIFQTNTGRYAIVAAGYYDDGPDEMTLTTINDGGYVLWTGQINGGLYFVDDECSSYYYTNGNTTIGDLFTMDDGSIIIVATSDALENGYKSEDCLGDDTDDFWVIKLVPDTCTLMPLYADYDNDDAGGDLVSASCTSFSQYTISTIADCDDTRSSIYTDAPEICDGFDNDCDGLIDEGLIDCNPGPEIAWNRTYGSDSLDRIEAVAELPDGFVYVGTKSTYNPTTPGETNYDISVRKSDANGDLIWYRTIDGISGDYGRDVIGHPDGTMLVVGSSSSGVGGDKTEASMGGLDCWMVKLDADGNILWQNTIGGASTDEVASAIPTSDGGYLLAVSSYSGNSGDKTELSFGSQDVWLIKLTSTGTIQWQNSIGGSAQDAVASIYETADGGFIVGANSYSGISGEKTTLNFGSQDYWILKLTSTGSITWQKSYGGTGYEVLAKVVQSDEGGYVVFGSSTSGISILKSELSYEADIWLLKLNGIGNIVWENTIQAEDQEIVTDMVKDPVAGFLLLSASESLDDYDKTEPFVTKPSNPILLNYNYDNQDYWLIHIDALGTITWQNTIGGNRMEMPTDLCLTNAGDLLLAGYSSSFSMADKSEDPVGELIEIFYEGESSDDPILPDVDGWVVKLDYTCNPTDELCNTLDDDCDGLIDDDVIESVTISTADPLTFCSGGSALLEATYTGATVQWMRNGTILPGATSSTYAATTKGNYTCQTLSDCSTAESAPIFVNVLKNPPASITAGGPTTFCDGGSVTLTANAGAGLSYQWYNGPVLIPGATNINYTATTAGAYKCKVTKMATGCSKLSSGILVSVPCDAGVMANTSAISVFPNPATTQITITGLKQDAMVNIYNAIGQVVLVAQSPGNELEISVEHLAKGMYTAQVEDAITRFIIQ